MPETGTEYGLAACRGQIFVYRPFFVAPRGLDELAGVEDPARVHSQFEGGVSRNSFFPDCVGEPSLLGESNPMLSCNDATALDDPLEEFVQSVVRFFSNFRILVILHHQIGVNVAVSRVPKARDRDSSAILHFAGEFDEVQELGARHNNILIEFCQSGVAQRVGEIAPQLPDLFAGLLVAMVLRGKRAKLLQEAGELLPFALNRLGAAIDLNDEMRISGWKSIGSEIVTSGLESETCLLYTSPSPRDS
mgnify:CR=1 FL=1